VERQDIKIALKVKELSQELIDLAIIGQECAQDNDSLLFYGLVQDCAYKIRQAVEREQARTRLAC